MSQKFTRNVGFTSTSSNYELLQDTNIKASIKERIGIDNDVDYLKFINDGLLNIYIDIFFNTDSGVSINGGYYQRAIEEIVYSSGNYITGVRSIKIEDTGISGILSFNIK